MFQKQDRNKNLLMLAAVLIVLVSGGALWFFLTAGPTTPSLAMVDVSVQGKVYGFIEEDIKLLVPETATGNQGAFIKNKERRVDVGSVSSVIVLDTNNKSKNMASVSDIRYDFELVVYGKTSDLENGVIVADKIEILK